MAKSLKRHSTYTSKTKNVVLDKDTGEVLSEDVKSELITRYVNGNDKFVLFFKRTIASLRELDKMAYLVIMHYAINCEEGEMRFVANKYYNNQAAMALDITAGTVKNAIQALYKKDFIRRVGNGVYLINPAVFWKGSMNKRPEAFEKYTQHKTGSSVDLVKDFENDDFNPLTHANI